MGGASWVIRRPMTPHHTHTHHHHSMSSALTPSRLDYSPLIRALRRPRLGMARLCRRRGRAMVVVGLLWDISWHMSIGRDTSGRRRICSSRAVACSPV
jgi:hypothetical protein